MNQSMSSDAATAEDQQFIHQFEQCTLETLDHLGHLRLTWLYLQRYECDQVTDLLCNGLQSFTASKGLNQKFHRTITVALVRIVANRIKRLDNVTWENFLVHNADIVQDYRSVLHHYYKRQTLSSDRARASYVAPDIQPF